MPSNSFRVLALGFMLSAYPLNAYAYLDPGTGSIILQGIIAVIAGGLLTMKLYWQKLSSFFRRDRASPDLTPEAKRPDEA